MKRASLNDLALTTSTDKSSRFHSYCGIYDELFTPFRDKPVRFLEVGILGGDSLRMWGRYFHHHDARIVGVDLVDRNFQSEDGRIETIYGDAGKAMFLAALPGPFTIAMDDGGHWASHQITFFEALWPQIEPGGILVIEDVHAVHSPQHRDAHLDILDFFNRIAHEMQDDKGADGCAAPNPDDRWHGIVSIEHRKGLIIVRKRA